MVAWRGFCGRKETPSLCQALGNQCELQPLTLEGQCHPTHVQRGKLKFREGKEPAKLRSYNFATLGYELKSDAKTHALPRISCHTCQKGTAPIGVSLCGLLKLAPNFSKRGAWPRLSHGKSVFTVGQIARPALSNRVATSLVWPFTRKYILVTVTSN